MDMKQYSFSIISNYASSNCNHYCCMHAERLPACFVVASDGVLSEGYGQWRAWRLPGRWPDGVREVPSRSGRGHALLRCMLPADLSWFGGRLLTSADIKWKRIPTCIYLPCGVTDGWRRTYLIPTFTTTCGALFRPECGEFLPREKVYIARSFSAFFHQCTCGGYVRDGVPPKGKTSLIRT